VLRSPSSIQATVEQIPIRADALPLLIDALPNPCAVTALQAWWRVHYPDVPIWELPNRDADPRA
jgi:hypothetical protein